MVSYFSLGRIGCLHARRNESKRSLSLLQVIPNCEDKHIMAKHILTFALAMALFLTACGSSNAENAANPPISAANTEDSNWSTWQTGINNSNSDNTQTTVQVNEENTLQSNIAYYQGLSDEELVSRLAEGLDICLIGDNELLFTDVKDIPSSTLYMLFVYLCNTSSNKELQEKYESYSEQGFIPARDVTALLNQYFDNPNFVPEEANANYDASKDVFTGVYSGFGGGRFPKLISKNFLDDHLTLKVAFYDDRYKVIYYTKTYKIRFTDNGYKYLSITKESS